MKIGASKIPCIIIAFALAGCIDLSELGVLVPPTADQDPLLPQIQIEVAGHSRAVHLQTFGDPSNPVALVLHGAASDFRGLKPLAALADRYYLVLWDQRGSGLSERVSESEISWNAVIEEMDAIRERFSQGRRVTLIGHSWGGAYAAMYLGRRPEQVRQAVLVEPLALTGEIMENVFPEMFELRLADEVWNDSGFFGRVLTPGDHARLDYRYLLQLKTNMTNFNCDKDSKPDWPLWRAGAYAEHVRQQLIAGRFGHFHYDYTVGLQDFEAEVLIVGSECSALGWEFQASEHRHLFRNARVERIYDAGHSVIVEQTDALLEVMRGYLEEYQVRLLVAALVTSLAMPALARTTGGSSRDVPADRVSLELQSVHVFLVEASYGRRFTERRDLVLEAALALPLLTIDRLDDFDLSIGASAEIGRLGRFGLRGGLFGSLVYTENANGEFVAFGLEAALMPGYFGERWFIALDFRLRATLAAHLTHADRVRDTFDDRYPEGTPEQGRINGPKDGWVGLPATTVMAGLVGGYTIKRRVTLYSGGGIDYPVSTEGVFFGPSIGILPIYGLVGAAVHW